MLTFWHPRSAAVYWGENAGWKVRAYAGGHLLSRRPLSPGLCLPRSCFSIFTFIACAFLVALTADFFDRRLRSQNQQSSRASSTSRRILPAFTTLSGATNEAFGSKSRTILSGIQQPHDMYLPEIS